MFWTFEFDVEKKLEVRVKDCFIKFHKDMTILKTEEAVFRRNMFVLKEIAFWAKKFL